MIIPVLSSACSLTLALAEYHSLVPWLSTPRTPHLRVWFDSWFRIGLAGVLVLGLATTTSGYIAWRDSLGPARSLCGYGTCFAIAHFVYAPTIARCIQRLVHGPTDPHDELALWLKIHTLRTLTTDLPAFLCFLAAFLHV